MLPVQPSPQKYSRSLLTQITCISLAIPAHTKGRFAIVTDVGLGMRWTRAALLTRALPCGRRSRVVLTPRRWRQAGGNNFCRRWWQESPVTKESTKQLLKPSRAGMPGDPGATVVTNARVYYTPRAAAGATGTRHSPLPLGVAPRPLLGGRISCNNSSAWRGENTQLYLAVRHRCYKRAPPRATPF
jgi:hypothetical protein